MTNIIFSGKTTRCGIPALNKLFGANIPVEAVNLIFDAPAEMLLSEARAKIEAMAAQWDQPRLHLNRLRAASESIAESVAIAGARLADADETQRVYLIAVFSDAADELEAAEQDMQHLRGEDE